MVEPDASSLLKERLRFRELVKFYQAVLPQNHGLTGIDEPFADDFKPLLPRLATDPQLTALAQLAAFRTNCQRACISLVDHKAHHLIAEATRSISVFNENLHGPGDALVIGAQTFPLNFGVCPRTVDVFRGESDTSFQDPTNISNKDHVIIADLTTEGKTKDTPAIKLGPPLLRYYVEVPLLSESGMVLGTICALDSSPRNPDMNHVVALQEVAKLVVQHLETSRMKQDHRRAELLLSGLAHFVQGQDSMSVWSEKTPGQEFIPPVPLSRAQLSVDSLASLQSPNSDRRSSTYAAATVTANVGLVDSSVSSTTRATAISSDTEESSAKVSSVTSASDEVDVGFDPLPPNEQLSPDAAHQKSEASINVRHTFSRASNLIREAMDLDATMFLEVPHNDRFKDPRSRRQRVDSSGTATPDTSNTSSKDSDQLTDSSDSSSRQRGSRSRENKDLEFLCHRLGYATRLKSSLAGSTVAQSSLTVPATMLSRLSLRYPHGHIFHFDSYGSISSGDDEEVARSSTHTTPFPRGKSSSRLHRMFPDARSLIFLPMYDNDKQHIYAGFIGMSTNPTRALQKHESTYVSAFVNSLMCEVMRLEALSTDRAKSDFISSISHELRSPLHGILASSQLLAESNVRPSQIEFVHMIDTCARTLLDTMDHLLDHAKINHFTQQQTLGRENSRSTRSSQPQPYSLISSTNMLSVVEETVASMAASSNQMLQNVEGKRHATGSDTKLSVPVIIDILPHKSWLFDTEAGSWRRIVMNLVGNSLKYTQEGHVKVNLSIREQSDKKHVALLEVVDTGQGISEEYLKHRLYTPFSQENNLSVGTGLGLSLVHQIVSSLHGDMRIFSEVGNGTKVSIKVPLSISKDEGEQQVIEAQNSVLLASTQEQTFTFLGFEKRPPLAESPTGMVSSHVRTLSAIKSSLSDILIQWFGSKPVSKNASITIVEERYLDDNLRELDQPGQRLLVVGLKGRGNTVTDRLKHATHAHILPPIGPTKVATMLKLLLTERKSSNVALTQNLAQPESRVQKRASTCSVTEIIDLSRPTTPSSHVNKEAILLVDDNSINLRILVTCLKKLNLKDVDLLTASDGSEAVDKYKATLENGVRISAIFMDISMPVMDGFQATRQIRLFEKSRGVTKNESANIMALTGLASAEALREVKASGFDSYLRKPVNLRTIREVLAAARI